MLRLQFETGKDKDTKTITSLRRENAHLESNITDLRTTKTRLEAARADMKALLIMLQSKIEEIDGLSDLVETPFTEPDDNIKTSTATTPSSIEKLRFQAIRCKDQLSAIKKKLDFQHIELSEKVKTVT